jgi:hypothetical protein
VSKYKVKGIKLQSQNIKEYGLDIESELTKILSEQIAKEIDKEILSSLGLEERKYHRKKSINKIFNI